MSGGTGARKPPARNFSPFPPADDYVPADQPAPEDSEAAIPLVTPFQRYMVDGLKAISNRLEGIEHQVAEMAPQVKRLEADAALAKKVLTYAKYVGTALAARYFPEFVGAIAKYAPAIFEAAGKASP